MPFCQPTLALNQWQTPMGVLVGPSLLCLSDFNPENSNIPSVGGKVDDGIEIPSLTFLRPSDNVILPPGVSLLKDKVKEAFF